MWVDAAQAVDRLWPVDRVASFSEVDQDRAAAVAAALGLPFADAGTVRRVNDKLAMRARLGEAGVSHLPYRAVESPADLAAFLHETGAPVVLKPSCGRGSVGISIVESEKDIGRAMAWSAAASGPRTTPSPLLAESFVPGAGLVVDAMSQAGVHHVLAVVETIVDPVTHVDLAHVTPARISPAELSTVVDHVRAVLTALGVRDGLTNTDVIVGPHGPVVLETHLRAAGNRIPQLVQLTTGVDELDLWARQVAGHDLALGRRTCTADGLPAATGSAAVAMLTTTAVGKLRAIDGWDAVAAADGVVEHTRFVDDGAELTGLHSDFSYLGDVVTTAGTPDRALSMAMAAMGALEVRT